MQYIIPAAKPAAHILRVQKKKPEAAYRLFQYLIQAPAEDGLLLYNVLTKELILLSPEEAGQLTEPGQVQDELIARWFMVPEGQDDHALAAQFAGLAACLDRRGTELTSYTIFTTTDCNARCFYCYELGRSRVPMRADTALRLADYMLEHCGGKALHLRWFGGEPLYNQEVIDLICGRLREAGQEYRSSMISNGYLFDSQTVDKAVNSWRLERVQITLDGTEDVYNRSKAYIYKDGSPYRRVMDNIARLLDAGIAVSVRLNIGAHNAADLFRLVDELAARFGRRRGIFVYANPLFENNDFGVLPQVRARREETYQKQLELQEYIFRQGLSGRNRLRRGIRTGSCMADNDQSVVVAPDGHIGKCEHFSESEFCSHIDTAEWDEEMLRSWKEKAGEYPDCQVCVCYPECFRLKKCPNGSVCFPEARMMQEERLRQAALNEYLWFRGRQPENKPEDEPEEPNC